MVDGWSSPSDSPRLGLLCLDRDSLRSSRSSLLRLSSAALRLTCSSQKDNTKIPAYDLVSRSELSSQPVQNGTKHLSPPTLNVHLLVLFALELNEHRETDVKESNWLCV